MECFVNKDSIVRKIWGKSDTVLFIFAGAAAEFALNKAVDWLYFTGRLPADPIGRLFSTVSYAHRIIFSEKEEAIRAIRRITAIHSGVEESRGYAIPDWAYRDVLYMLIHYSIAAFELLERRLTTPEKEELFDVFYRVGMGMGLKQLPSTYSSWCDDRELHMQNDLQLSRHSLDLFEQYKKHLGASRYRILLAAQKMVVPSRVSSLLGFGRVSWLAPAIPLYRFSRYLHLDKWVRNILLPSAYKEQIDALNVV